MVYSEMLKEYNDVLTPEEVQKILRVGRNTVYSYLSKGILPSVRVAKQYRVSKLAVLKFLNPDEDFSEEAK